MAETREARPLLSLAVILSEAKSPVAAYDREMSESLPIHEQEFVRAFILKGRQERCAFLLSNPGHRRKLRDALPHFKWLDERFAHPIPPKLAHTAAELVALLRSKGAGRTVWVISERASMDGREMNLEDAMEETWGAQQGTILSCVPGKLAFFKDEEMHSERLLQRS
jgi:hypothetical protein